MLSVSVVSPPPGSSPVKRSNYNKDYEDYDDYNEDDIDDDNHGWWQTWDYEDDIDEDYDDY